MMILHTIGFLAVVGILSLIAIRLLLEVLLYNAVPMTDEQIDAFRKRLRMNRRRRNGTEK